MHERGNGNIPAIRRDTSPLYQIFHASFLLLGCRSSGLSRWEAPSQDTFWRSNVADISLGVPLVRIPRGSLPKITILAGIQTRTKRNASKESDKVLGTDDTLTMLC